jgi:hypothetical protein
VVLNSEEKHFCFFPSAGLLPATLVSLPNFARSWFIHSRYTATRIFCCRSLGDATEAAICNFAKASLFWCKMVESISAT